MSEVLTNSRDLFPTIVCIGPAFYHCWVMVPLASAFQFRQGLLWLGWMGGVDT